MISAADDFSDLDQWGYNPPVLPTEPIARMLAIGKWQEEAFLADTAWQVDSSLPVPPHLRDEFVTPPPGSPLPVKEGPARNYALAALKSECAKVSSTFVGSGLNKQLNESAFVVGTLIQPLGIHYDEAWEALYEAALQAGANNPDKDKDTLHRALSDGSRKPRDLTSLNGQHQGESRQHQKQQQQKQQNQEEPTDKKGESRQQQKQQQQKQQKQQNQEEPTDKSSLNTTPLMGMLMKSLEWLVPNMLPLGKIALLAGDGGHCKSMLTLELAAALSRGRCAWGLEYPPLPEYDTLLISCEDDFEDTVLPRLVACDADLSKIARVNGVNTKDRKQLIPFSLKDVDALSNTLEKNPSVKLVVIDPATAYVGRAGIDDHRDSELRALLGPLAECASRHEIVVLLVMHINKGQAPRAVARVMGGAGYVNSARAAFLIAPDPHDPERRLLAPMKRNLSPRPTAFAYRPVPLPEAEGFALASRYPHLNQESLSRQFFRLAWEGPIEVEADGMLQPQGNRKPKRVEEAMDWLKSFLATYAYPSDEILEHGKKAGFNFDNIKEAKTRLKDEGTLTNKKFPPAKWWSGLGPPHGWVFRPEGDCKPEVDDSWPPKEEARIPDPPVP